MYIKSTAWVGAMVWKGFKLAAGMGTSVKIKCGVNIAMGQENKW